MWRDRFVKFCTAIIICDAVFNRCLCNEDQIADKRYISRIRDTLPQRKRSYIYILMCIGVRRNSHHAVEESAIDELDSLLIVDDKTPLKVFFTDRLLSLFKRDSQDYTQ